MYCVNNFLFFLFATTFYHTSWFAIMQNCDKCYRNIFVQYIGMKNVTSLRPYHSFFLHIYLYQFIYRASVKSTKEKGGFTTAHPQRLLEISEVGGLGGAGSGV